MHLIIYAFELKFNRSPAGGTWVYYGELMQGESQWILAGNLTQNKLEYVHYDVAFGSGNSDQNKWEVLCSTALPIKCNSDT